MKILVTGGTVFVSRYAAEYFVKGGHEVYVLNRNTKPQVDGVRLIECDRHDIGERLKGYSFDAVIDVTAYSAGDVDLLLDGLADFDDYILISSSAVYPETLEIPFKVGDRCGANSFWGAYGMNKIAAENALLKRVPGAYVVRPPYIYGEYNNVYREAFVFDCAERNAPFYLPQKGKMPLQFFHVEDLCKFIEALLELRPARKIFNVGNKPVTVKEWVTDCYSAVGKIPNFIEVPGEIEQRNYFPFYNYAYALDTTAQNEILTDPIPLGKGLRRAYK
ncbi:MAG: NAD-dependent epimerase/dehydratase family protein, partial [Clostridia bacterium]|nr:NAD-dependent epimerase/dehydratase family protein [Clostridia bacterium]